MKISGQSRVRGKDSVFEPDPLPPPKPAPLRQETTISAKQAILEGVSPTIIEVAELYGARLREVGGLAFKRLCPSAHNPRFYRENKDIDLMGRREDTKAITKAMEVLAYKPRELFNKLNMGQRLIYYDMTSKFRIDIFLDEFAMCHKFDFRESILANTYTLPITQLMMTKLQVVQKTDKEYKDLMLGLHDFDVTNGKSGIRGDEIANLAAKDWGVYTTFRKSLHELITHAQSAGLSADSPVVPRAQKLIAMMDSHPKSMAWKLRAKIGEKARWYELPDADSDEIFGP